MRDGARLAAAIEILSDIDARKRPGAEAVRDWMLSHRFAGSKDRSEVGDLVFGALRWKASSAWRLADDSPRAWVLGAVHWGFGRDAEAIGASLIDDPHAPAPLSDFEIERLRAATLADAPAHVRGDYPEWLEPSFARAFGDARAEEGAALAAPAPLDLRANALKTERDALIKALSESPRLATAPSLTPFAPSGVRIPWREGKNFPWNTEQSFAKGWFEVQDEGSQIAAALAQAETARQVGDICAGAGGKTLALAAAMENKGQIYAFDIDGRRLAPLKERLDRAGVRNAQIRAPQRSHDALADLEGKLDLVFADAPCTGSGTWRRNPDSKWRVRPTSLEQRMKEQDETLALAARLVKPGGRIVYVTCSVLPEEGVDRIDAFLAANAQFSPLAFNATADLRARSYARGDALQLTPARTGCDGFFIAQLTRGA